MKINQYDWAAAVTISQGIFGKLARQAACLLWVHVVVPVIVVQSIEEGGFYDGRSP